VKKRKGEKRNEKGTRNGGGKQRGEEGK